MSYDFEVRDEAGNLLGVCKTFSYWAAAREVLGLEETDERLRVTEAFPGLNKFSYNGAKTYSVHLKDWKAKE